MGISSTSAVGSYLRIPLFIAADTSRAEAEPLKESGATMYFPEKLFILSLSFRFSYTKSIPQTSECVNRHLYKNRALRNYAALLCLLLKMKIRAGAGGVIFGVFLVSLRLT
jgi:hypothetical protein